MTERNNFNSEFDPSLQQVTAAATDNDGSTETEEETKAIHISNPEVKQTYVDKLPLDKLRAFKAKYLTKSIENNQIDEDDFEHIYTESEIAEDKKRVQDMIGNFISSKSVEGSQEKLDNDEKLEIIAKLFEVMCSDHSVLSRVFNVPKGEVVAQMSSDFDDIFRKVDLFIEFPKKKFKDANPSDYAMGVDVTISKANYMDKLRGQRAYFEKNDIIPDVKYFRESAYNHSKDTDAFEGHAALPKFIINSPPKDIAQLIPAWEKWSDGKNRLKDEKEKQGYLRVLKILDNPIWIRINYQMLSQARVLEKYFERSDPEISKMYGQAKQTLLESQSKILSGFIQRDKSLYEKLTSINMERDEAVKNSRMKKIYMDKLGDLINDETKITVSKFAREFR